MQWERRLPLTKSYAGNATSPIITGDRVILYRGNYVDHFAWALDKRTGEELWKVQQSEKFSTDVACTATPIVANGAVILHSARAVQALDLASGERVWRLRCATTATSTPILAGDEVIVATWNQTGEASLTPTLPSFEKLLADRDRDGDKMIGGKEFPRLMIFHRSEGVEAPQNGAPLRFAYVDADKNGKINSAEWERWLQKDAQRRTRYTEHGLLAIPLKSAGEVSDDRIRRLAKEGIPEVPSPLHYRGRAYFVKNGGILTCIDLKTGNRDYRLRTRGRGTHYASPVIAGEHLYTASGDGKISVIHLGDKGKIVAVNDMGDPVYATPAVVDGVIYVRTHHTLYAFGVKR